MDIAFNPRLVGYNTGKVNREPRQVLRVGKFACSSVRAPMAKNSMAQDDSGAGESFWSQELAITHAYKSDLVVTVGEYLSNFQMPTELVILGKGKYNTDSFCPERHTIVPTENQTLLVVRKLAGHLTSLHVLADMGEDGSCKLLPLPSTVTDDPRLFFYKEWTDGPSDSAHRRRSKRWKANISEFCERFIIDNQDNFLDKADIELQPSWPEAPAVLSAVREGDRDEILKSLVLYNSSRVPAYLDQALENLNKVLGSKGCADDVFALLFTRPEDVDEESALEVAIATQVGEAPLPSYISTCIF